MEDSTKSSKEEEDDWKVVRPRKGKPQINRLRHVIPNDGHLSCYPVHSPHVDSCRWDSEEEQKLRTKLHKCVEQVRSSLFFKKLIEQMHCLQILEKLLANFNRARPLDYDKELVDKDLVSVPSVRSHSAHQEAFDFRISDGQEVLLSTVQAREICLGDFNLATTSQSVIEFLVLGVGTILDSEVSRCQMSLALLLKDHFSCIGNVLVYDPVLSTMECSVLRSLGCIPIVQNDNGKWRARSSTLLYMPHCGASLYNSLIEQNRDPWCLGWVSILGNSFQEYQDRWSVSPKPKYARPDCLLDMQKHVTEHSVDAASFPCLSAFNAMSWHLFPINKIV